MTTNQPSIQRPSTHSPPSAARVDTEITLRCLGAAGVFAPVNGATSTPLVGLGKQLAMLVYLALAPNRTASREQLADLLWADQDRANARASVRRALHHLRTHIAPWVAWGDDHSCTASPDLCVDVTDFVTLVGAGRYAEALEHYRGDFLADFASPGSRQFEEWASIERAHLRSQAARAGESWCRAALNHARYAEARRAADRVKSIDPHSELGWRLSLESFIAGGDRVGAIAEATRFRAWLDSEDVEAEPASQALIRAALRVAATASAEPHASHALVAELVGREREFSTILKEWERSSAGAVRLVLTTGPAGFGKSRLLDAVAQRLRSLRQRVLILRAFPGERALEGAFAGTLAYELSGLSGAIAVSKSVVPDLRALDARVIDRFPGAASPTHTPAAAATAVRELLSAVCDEAPLALLIDDAHWLDDQSRQLLVGSLSRLGGVPLLVVISSRAPVDALNDDERATSLALAPLAEQEVAALVDSLGTLPTDQDWTRHLIAKVTQSSRGIPLFVLSALEQLTADGTIALEDGRWAARDGMLVRARLEHIDAFGARLRALSPPSFRLLVACSIAGVPLPANTVETLEMRLASAENGSIRQLEQLGYLRRSESGIAVGHDAVAEAALAMSPEAERVALTRELGLALVAASDARWIDRGLRHLASVGDVSALLPPLLGVIRRRLPPGTPPIDFVAATLGRSRSDPLVRDVARAFPMSLKLRCYSRVIGASITAVVLLVAGLTYAQLANDREPVSDIEVILKPSGSSGATAARVPLAMSGWAAAIPFELSYGPLRDTLFRPTRGALVLPGADAWAVEIYSPDSGGVDVAVVSRDGRVRRLTSARADELPASWSPDGRHLAILTSAFSLDKHKSLGVLHASTGRVRGLGRIDRGVGAAFWSPDGTRIAYLQEEHDALDNRLCIVTVDGTSDRCVLAGATVVQLSGWLDESRLLLVTGAHQSLDVFELTTSRLLPTGVDGVSHADLSPDRRWLSYARAAGTRLDLFVAPSGEPRRARRLASSVAADAIAPWAGPFAKRRVSQRAHHRSGS